MFKEGSKYKTQADLLITVLKNTPQCKYKMVGYFEIRNIRIRVFYDEIGNEFFGESGLNLMRKLPDSEGGPLISERRKT